MSLEDDLIAAVEAGTVLDLAGSSRPDRAEMDSWGPDRTIEAGVIRDVLLGRKASNADPHGVQLRGLRISGPLDLYNVQSDLDLSLSDCLIEGGIVLRRARLRMVSFTGCVLPSGEGKTCLDGQQVAVAALYLNDSTFDADGAATAIDLRNARVTGPLVLSGARLNGRDGGGNSLIGDELTVDGGIFLLASDKSRTTAAGAIRLLGAHIDGQLNLSGAQLNGYDTTGSSLIGDRLTVAGGVFFTASGESTFTAAGAIRLPGAHVQGQLVLSGAQLTGQDSEGYSLIGHGLVVDGDMFLRSDGRSAFTTAGAIWLPGAHIGGQLILSGAQLNGHDTDGDSLIAHGLTVASDMFLSSDRSAFVTAGAVRLQGAHIGGQLNLSGAQLNGHDTTGNSLIGDGLTVDGSMFLRTNGTSTFTTAGAIRLPGAHVHGQLNLSGAQLNGHDTDGDSLIAHGLTVDRDVFLRVSGGSAFTTAGALRLSRARILGQLQVPSSSLRSTGGLTLSLAGASVGELSLDLPDALPAGVQVDLKDATYTGLARLDDLAQWLTLLRHHTVAYTPQAYQQLATVHRAAGHEHDARRILIAQQEDRRSRLRSRIRRAGLGFLKVAIGYGYRTWPAFVGVLVLAALGAGLGILAGHTHVGTQFAAYRPVSAVRTVNQNCSIVEQASLGVRVPFLSNLGTGDCVLDTASVPGGVYSAAIWTDQALAWAAATLAVAGYTGLVRRT